MTDDQDRDMARGQEEQARTSTQSVDRQGQSNPFLRQIRQLERQGVPEEGAANPGPPLKPVRSGEYHAERVPPQSQGEEP